LALGVPRSTAAGWLHAPERSVERSRSHLSLRSALRVVAVSPAAYHSWTRERRQCGLERENRICPRSRPDRLTDEEVALIRRIRRSVGAPAIDRPGRVPVTAWLASEVRLPSGGVSLGRV